MRKTISLLLAMAMLLALCAFPGAMAEETGNWTEHICENVADTDTCATYKVAGERLIEVTYSDYDYETGVAGLAKHDMQASGCSAVCLRVDGDVYVGRNYDYNCAETPAMIVRNNAGPIRTVGIASMPGSMPDWTGEDYELPDELLLKLPFLCSDVMSEAGLYAEANMRTVEEALICSSTNPGAPRRCTQTIIQTMLSQYTTIDEILAHVDDYDWFDLSAMGLGAGYMFVDQSGRSIVIEFAANSWSYTEVDYNSNFYFNNDYYAIEKYPVGEMRSSRELAYKPYVRTEEDVFTMMAQGAYAQFYTKAVDLEYALPELAEDVGYDRFDPSTYDTAIENLKKLLEVCDAYTWEERIANKCWETTYAVATNVTELHMTVHFSEHFGLEFEVAFEDDGAAAS